MEPALAAVIETLERELEEVRQRATSTAEGAVHEESRAEDPKDTRGLEASYLAHGLAERASALARDIDQLRYLPEPGATISAGVRFSLEDEEGEVRHYIMLPCAGGVDVRVGGARVTVVTPGSPLGRAFLGKGEGDDATVRAREYVVLTLGAP